MELLDGVAHALLTQVALKAYLIDFRAHVAGQGRFEALGEAWILFQAVHCLDVNKIRDISIRISGQLDVDPLDVAIHVLFNSRICRDKLRGH